jgi:hypothetical protein
MEKYDFIRGLGKGAQRMLREGWEMVPSRVDVECEERLCVISWCITSGHEEVVQVVPSHAGDGKRSTLSGTAGSIEHSLIN